MPTPDSANDMAAMIADRQPAAASAAGGKTAPPLLRPLLGLSDQLLHAPRHLRALVRANEVWLVMLAAIIGGAAGFLVAAMTTIAQALHAVLFTLSPGDDVSTATDLNPIQVLLVLGLGGLLVGGAGYVGTRLQKRRPVDPIEANALHGGRMSLNDSLWLVFLTLLSNGVGASVGLEAGYTQIAAAVASRLGRSFRVRRSDLRLLVGCGAAGAIAAAFDAPLAGAFYAYELVIGTYTIAALAPVVVAAIVANGVIQAIGGSPGGLEVMVPTAIEPIDYIPLLLLSLACALIAIAIMRGVTLTEAVFRRIRVPGWLRPMLGGLVVGALGLISPSVLSSGHGALEISIESPYTLGWVGALIVLKATANAVSIGAGFLGGLFFASLYLGGLVGKFFTLLLPHFTVAHTIPVTVCALVGMTSMAVAIVGGPLTMTFLALEETGSLPLTAAVLAACVVSSLTVRRVFGYSFATWRFHLRGESIRSAVDIGWIRNLTVTRIMRRENRMVSADMRLEDFNREVPIGTHQRLIVLDDAGQYAGIVYPAETHAIETQAQILAEMLHHQNAFLLPDMTIKQAIAMFETSETDALAVLDSPETRNVLGLLTEQYALRRYSEELDQKRRELSGD